MDKETQEKNVYGENVPTKDAPAEPGIREKIADGDPNKRGNEEAFDETVAEDGGLCNRCRSVVDSLEPAAGAMAGSSASPEGEG